MWATIVAMFHQLGDWTLVILVPLLDRLADQVTTTVTGLDQRQAATLAFAMWGLAQAAKLLVRWQRSELPEWRRYRRRGLTHRVFIIASALAVLPFLNDLATFAFKVFANIDASVHGHAIVVAIATLAALYVIWDLWNRPTFHLTSLIDHFVLPFLPAGAAVGYHAAQGSGLIPRFFGG
jgi:hypothetical protein